MVDLLHRNPRWCSPVDTSSVYGDEIGEKVLHFNNYPVSDPMKDETEGQIGCSSLTSEREELLRSILSDLIHAFKII